MIEPDIMPDSLTLKEKLNLETAAIPWKDLQICFAQGKLLIVDTTADVVDIASLISENNAKKVKQLIRNTEIAFATTEWIKTHCQEDTLLWAVVVAPYVVAQLKKI
jgi:hypothetical protein